MIVVQVLLYLFALNGAILGKSIVLEAAKEPFQLDDFLKGTFSAKSFNGSWISSNSFIYSDGDLYQFNVETQTSTPFLNKSVTQKYPATSTITVSQDLKFVLIRYNVSAVFRHSTTAQYALYDILKEEFHDIAEKEHIQLVQWSPVGNALAYVYLNNIYYLPTSISKPIPITTNGEPGIIYNGAPDWVYEEEVLGSGSALWFSPTGKRIAFATFDDTNVREFVYFLYGTPGSIEDQYPKEAKIRYPKVGTVNPTVSTFVVNLENLETTKENPIKIEAFPEHLLEDVNYVFYGVSWSNDDDLTLFSTNRIQNEGVLYRCNISGSCTTKSNYQESKGWLDVNLPKYNKVGSQRIEILPQPEEDDFFDHLVLTDESSDKTVRLTSGKFVVTTIYGWDEKTNRIFFGGSGENAPSQQHLYVVDVNTQKKDCLSCQLQTSFGLCLYAGASFSKDLSYFALICQGPGPSLVKIYNINQLEKEVLTWENNQELLDKLSTRSLPKIKDLKVPLVDGLVANVRLLLPPGLDENSNKKYPTVVNVYAGPNSNQITDSYSSGFQNYIVTNREYIYVFIDGRGSGRDGQKKMFTIYKKLATVEIQDQIFVTKYLQDNLSYIDRNKTGIWGWSYGGFSTAWTLVQDKEKVFTFGLSVAPVTNFILYDSIYTERYMGLPTAEDNVKGYNNTDVAQNVEAIRGKSFFLIHGNADDNVHYQQSMLLAKSLELADIAFLQQSYPDENHSLGGVSPHLYHTIDRFWARSFNLPDPPLVHKIESEEVPSVINIQ